MAQRRKRLEKGKKGKPVGEGRVKVTVTVTSKNSGKLRHWREEYRGFTQKSVTLGQLVDLTVEVLDALNPDFRSGADLAVMRRELIERVRKS